MYWKLFREMLDRSLLRHFRGGAFQWGSSAVLVVAIAGLLVADHEKGTGEYTKLRDKVVRPENVEAQLRPGGEEAIVLTRQPLGGSEPEFLSVTLLPGRGMDVLQITANVPGRGEVKLLASSDLAEAAEAMSGMGADYTGGATLTRGGPFLMPWAGRLGGELGVDGKSLGINWARHRFAVPVRAMEHDVPVAYGGYLLKAAGSDVEVNAMPDGGAAKATFQSERFAGRWPSETQTTISALLAGKALELSVMVKNTGDEATPVGVGWAPRFSIPSGEREQARLRVPAAMREVTKMGGVVPTGKLEAVKGTAYDFNAAEGARLGTEGLDDTFTQLDAALEGHPAVELLDPAAWWGLRITALSPSIKAVHVLAPADGDFVSISPQMNYDDPFSGSWGVSEDTGMVVLQPGQTVEWKIRVELLGVRPGLAMGQEADRAVSGQKARQGVLGLDGLTLHREGS